MEEVKKKEAGWSVEKVGIVIALLTSLAGNATSFFDRKIQLEKAEAVERRIEISNEKVSDQMRRQTTITLGLDGVRDKVASNERGIEFIRQSLVDFKTKTFPVKIREITSDIEKEAAEAKKYRVVLHNTDVEIKQQTAVIQERSKTTSRRLEAFLDNYYYKEKRKAN